MKGAHATMNYLWRGARRLARENPAEVARLAMVTEPFDLDGRTVQAEVVVEIRPIAAAKHGAAEC